MSTFICFYRQKILSKELVESLFLNQPKSCQQMLEKRNFFERSKHKHLIQGLSVYPLLSVYHLLNGIRIVSVSCFLGVQISILGFSCCQVFETNSLHGLRILRVVTGDHKSKTPSNWSRLWRHSSNQTPDQWLSCAERSPHKPFEIISCPCVRNQVTNCEDP